MNLTRTMMGECFVSHSPASQLGYDHTSRVFIFAFWLLITSSIVKNSHSWSKTVFEVRDKFSQKFGFSRPTLCVSVQKHPLWQFLLELTNECIGLWLWTSLKCRFLLFKLSNCTLNCILNVCSNHVWCSDANMLCHPRLIFGNFSVKIFTKIFPIAVGQFRKMCGHCLWQSPSSYVSPHE